MNKKVCSKCKIEKELTEFYKDKNRKDGYKEACKECRKIQRRKYGASNKKACKEYYYNHRIELVEKKKEYNKKIYNTEEGRKKVKERSIIYHHKRRAKIKQVANLGTYTKADWQECLKFFNYCDAYTGEPLNKDITVDHITPISKGGTNNINNLVPCKGSVNSSKRASLIDEWYPKQSYYSKKRHNKIKEWIRIKSQINLFEL